MTTTIRIGSTATGPARSGLVGALAGGNEPGPANIVEVTTDEPVADVMAHAAIAYTSAFGKAV